MKKSELENKVWNLYHDVKTKLQEQQGLNQEELKKLYDELYDIVSQFKR